MTISETEETLHFHLKKKWTNVLAGNNNNDNSFVFTLRIYLLSLKEGKREREWSLDTTPYDSFSSCLRIMGKNLETQRNRFRDYNGNEIITNSLEITMTQF
jgi:hypothetical protein